MIDTEDPKTLAGLLNTASDLLYLDTDPRREHMPTETQLGQLRQALRTVAERTRAGIGEAS